MERLFEIIREQSEKWDIDVLEINAEPDHLHVLIQAHPSVDLSKYINSIKTVSSRLIRKELKRFPLLDLMMAKLKCRSFVKSVLQPAQYKSALESYK